MEKYFWGLILFCWTSFAHAQLDTKPLIEDVGIDENLGGVLDLDLTFTNREGQPVTLRELVEGEIPTVIVPVYYSCPSLCTLVLNGVRDLINASNLELGRHYQVVNISIDPENTPPLAREKAANYYATLEDAGPAREHWHYLTGEQAQITKVMDQIGFRYKKIGDQYSHASMIALVSPEGKITRYLYGVRYESRDFRLAVVEASEGKVGSTMDRLLVYCFQYDPLAGKYVPVAQRIMKVGALISLLLLAGFLVLLWTKELINKRRLHV